MKRAVGALVLAALSMCAVTGCAPEGDDVNTSLTIDEAKSQTQAIEKQIIDLVPAESTAEVVQQPRGVLLACDDASVTWAGGAVITVQNSPDFTAMLQEIQEAFNSDENYATTLEAANSDEPVLTIRSGDHGLWIVGPMREGEVLDITSSSPCFPTPEGMQPSDRY